MMWGEGDEDTRDVFLRAWSGAGWVDLAGLGGRVSATGTLSVLPALASTGNQTCAAWALYNGDQVVGRCASH